nr:reverse transcriptase domain-containing protein [Tanacetum cinerariifolium]
MFYKENVNYPELIWEDFAFQIDHRKERKSRCENMPFLRFTKVIINYFLSQYKSLSNLKYQHYHTIKDDGIVSRLKFVRNGEDYQKYRLPNPDMMLNDVIKQSESYQMFHKYFTSLIPPKKSIVVPELRIISEVAPMVDNRTMEELLQAPKEGYEEAIIIPEINADHFEIKMNLLQLVQANPYHGFERENPHIHINNFKRITLTLKFRDVIKLMMFPYSLEGAARVWMNRNSRENASKTDDRNDKLADQILTLVDIFAKKVVTPATVKAVEESCVTSAPQNHASNHMAPPGFAPVQNSQNRLNNQKLREKDTNQIEKFFQIFRDLHFDISFADALLLMPKFASTIKSLLANKDKLFEFAKIPLNENRLAMLLNKIPEKLGDLGKFLIPRVAKEVFVKVGKFHFLTDFVVVDFEADPRVPLILGRSFLRTGRALIDVYGEEITLRVNDEVVTFNLNQTTRYSSTYDDMLVNQIDIIDVARKEYAQEMLGFSKNSSGGNPTSTSEPIISDSSPSLTPFEGSDFILEEIEAYLKDESIFTRN